MVIDEKFLDEILGEAVKSPRLRMNYNLHECLDDKVQRLINVLLPGTVIPIHRHQTTDETYILLRGKLVVVFYNEMGAQIQRIPLDPEAGCYGVTIPKGQWHAVEVAAPSALFEVKEGPYQPIAPEDTME